MDRNAELLQSYKNGDKTARDTLCQENMGLVLNVAKKFCAGGAEFDDISQTGTVGLLKAIDNFDDSFGVKFSTYAVPMIIGEIKRFLRDDGLLKVSRSLKQSAYRGYAARDELSVNLGREPTISEISQKANISVEELVEAFCATTVPDSINREVYTDSNQEFGEILAGKDNEETLVNRIAVRGFLKKLNPREQQIIYLRYFKGKTQAEIARVIGVSQVQVSRIEKKVLREIREREFE